MVMNLFIVPIISEASNDLQTEATVTNTLEDNSVTEEFEFTLTANDETTLDTAVKTINSNTTNEYRLEITGDIVITSDKTITDGTVTIVARGGNYSITSVESRFKLENSAVVSFGETGAEYTLTINLGNQGALYGIVAGFPYNNTSLGKAVLNLYEGVVISDQSGVGGVSDATINMYEGAVIKDNVVSQSGSGIYLDHSATFNMYGGTISGNYSTGSGGGIYVKGSSNTVNISGGTISNNTARNDGDGIRMDNGTLNISGNPTITGEDFDDLISAQDSANVNYDNLTSGASIDVPSSFSYEMTKEEFDQCKDYFNPPQGYFIFYEDGKMQVSDVVYTVTYNANDGTGTTENSAEYVKNSSVTVMKNGFTAPEGKEFLHWNTEEDGTGIAYNEGDEFDIAGNTTLYAIWTDPTWTVTFDLDESTEEVRILQSVGEVADTDAPTSSDKEGYEIEGWYTEDTYTTPVEFPCTITEDKVLYAKLEPITYTLSFNTDDDDAISVTYDSEIGNLPTPTDDNCDFKEWTIDGTSITESTIWKYGENKTAIASWSDESVVTNQTELQAALADSSVTTIIIGASFAINTEIDITDKDVTIISNGDYTISTTNNTRFRIYENATLTLGQEEGMSGNTLTLSLGNTTSSAAVIAYKSTSKLVMYDGVSVSNGTNIALLGGSTFEMYGGEISNNAGTNAGGVCLFDGTGTTFIMYGGRITGNTTSGNGGGIHVRSATTNPVVEIYGGEISGNTASNGTAIYIDDNTATVTISGNPEISGVATDTDNTNVIVNNLDKITYTNLKEGASIDVPSTFTLEIEEITYETYKEYFNPPDGYCAYYEDGMLQFSNAYYTLSYDVNEGSGTMTDSKSYTRNEIATIATNTFIAPAGKEFNHWNTQADGKGDAYSEGSTITMTDDVTLYAIWSEPTYTVSFVKDGTTYPVKVVKNTAISEELIPTSTKTGYEVTGWYEDSGYSGTAVDLEGAITGDITLYAKVEPITYTLSFDTADTAISVTYDSTIGTLPIPTKENYDFSHWEIDGTTIQTGDTWQIASDKNAIAVWDLKPVQIVYTEQELRDALAQTSVTDIVVGGSFTITSDVTFDRAVSLYSNGNYTIDNGDSTTVRFVVTARDVNFGQSTSSVADANTPTLTLCLGGTVVGIALNNASSELNLYDGILISGLDGSRGIGLLTSYAVLNMYGGEISNVTYNYQGAGIVTTANYTTVNMYGGTIQNNTATNKNGGGVYIYGTGSVFNMSGGTIKNNSANTGGGLYIDSATVTITDSAIDYNTATSNGGGIYITGTTANVTINDTEIAYNEATTGSGGGIYNNGELILINSEIHDNTSSGNGGGVVAGSSGSIILTSGSIYNNQSTSGYGDDLRASNSGGITISEDFLIYNDTDASNSISISTTTDIDVDRILSYDANGGTGSAPSSSSLDNTTSNSEVYTVTVAENTLTAPTGTGADGYPYIFGGWNTQADGSGINYLPGEEISIYTSAILYANWKEAKSYTLTLNYKYPDGTIEVATVAVTFGSAVSGLPDPTFGDDDAIFKGWFIDGKEIKNGDLWTYESDKTATDKWNLWYVDTADELQTAVNDAEEGDIIKITDDITLTSTITATISGTQNVTLTFIGEKSDGSKPTISSGKASTDMFNIGGTGSNGSGKTGIMTLTFDNIIFEIETASMDVIDTGCYNATSAYLTIQNCEFYDEINSWPWYSVGHIVSSTRAESIVFTNNIVDGKFSIPIYCVLMNQLDLTNPLYEDKSNTGYIEVTDNTFNGDCGSEVIQVYFTTTPSEGEEHKVIVKSNIFNDTGTCVVDFEHSVQPVNLEFHYNVMMDVTYAIRMNNDTSVANTFETEYNYYESKDAGTQFKVSGTYTNTPINFDNYYKRADIPNITVTEDNLHLEGFDFATTGASDSDTYYTGPYYYVIAEENADGEYEELWRVYESGTDITTSTETTQAYDVIDPSETTAIDIQSDWYGKELVIYKVSIDPNIPNGALGSTVVNAMSLLSSDLTIALDSEDTAGTGVNIPCIVTFDIDGDTTTMNSQTVNYNEQAIEPEAPTKTSTEGINYTFAGWYTESNGETKWDFDTDTVTENITLYAKWIENSIVPDTGVNIDFVLWIGITATALILLIVRKRVRVKGGEAY